MAKKPLVDDHSSLFNEAAITGVREGIRIEKGIVLNEEYLEKNFDEIGKVCGFFCTYPDVFIDLITPEDDSISLFFYQRIFLRAVMRFKTIYVTACRAWSKSFLTILGLMLQCIFIPNHKAFICAPNKS